MDILTHTLSGVAIATAVATYAKTSVRQKIGIIFTGALGGTLPDIDAISMWSRFDATFGKLFNLSHSGKVIYGSKFWYSHHAFFHSLIGCLITSILLLLVMYSISYFLKKNKISIVEYFKQRFIYFAVFILGFLAHIAGDLPTPSSVWGGVAAWWPSKEYIGGYGSIWWWNNYDIFLIIVLVIFMNISLYLFSKYLKDKLKVMTISILLIGLCLILVQIKTRKFDYAYTKNTNRYTEMEENSKKEQKRILGNKLYSVMEKLDGRLKIHF